MTIGQAVSPLWNNVETRNFRCRTLIPPPFTAVSLDEIGESQIFALNSAQCPESKNQSEIDHLRSSPN